MSLDVIFASIGQNIVPATGTPSVYPSLAAADVSEAQIVPGFVFLESLYGDGQSLRGSCSMLQTPLAVSGRSWSRSDALEAQRLKFFTGILVPQPSKLQTADTETVSYAQMSSN